MLVEIQSFVSEFLSFLELQEARLLSWGFFDVSEEADGVEELFESQGSSELITAWRDLQTKGWDMPSLLSEMEQGGLLHRTSSATAYRTRLAEGVRLIARLRQMFQPKDWASARTLVSDIKLHLAPRRYPRRDQPTGECWKDIEPHCSMRDLQQAAFYALATGRDGKPYDFVAFQRRAFAHILGQYGGKGITGSVISAGTGSGKTKAFYIPAFLGAVTELQRDQPPFTKIIAIYPRTILLADQLREALSEAEKLRPVLEKFGLRPFTFGALLGSTPEQDWFAKNAKGKYYAETGKTGWKHYSNGWVIPFLKSPVASGEDLLWRDVDRLKGSTALYRTSGDSPEPDVRDGALVLTREQLKETPPDFLFLSAEMLNREMGNPEWVKTFGMSRRGPAPRLLLLDEVHAYEGMSGAQVA